MDTSGGGGSKPMPLHDLDGEIGTIADDRVHLPAQQPLHVRYLVDGPHLHGDAGLVRVADEPRGDDARRAREFRNLKGIVPRPPYRPSHPRPVEGEACFLLRRSCQDSRLVRTGCPQHFRPEGAQRDTIDGPGRAHDVDGSMRELGIVDLELDDDGGRGIAPEDALERRNTPGPAAKSVEVEPGIQPGERVRRLPRHRPASIRGSLQRGVVVDDDHAIAREVNVQFEPVRTEGQAVVEGEDRVLRPQQRPAPMREHLRPRQRERWMTSRHDWVNSTLSAYQALSPVALALLALRTSTLRTPHCALRTPQPRTPHSRTLLLFEACPRRRPLLARCGRMSRPAEFPADR